MLKAGGLRQRQPASPVMHLVASLSEPDVQHSTDLSLSSSSVLKVAPQLPGAQAFMHSCQDPELPAMWYLQGPAQVWTAPKHFERESTKFWLRPGDEMRFKVAMCCHLPVLIFGKARQLVPGERLYCA